MMLIKHIDQFHQLPWAVVTKLDSDPMLSKPDDFRSYAAFLAFVIQQDRTLDRQIGTCADKVVFKYTPRYLEVSEAEAHPIPGKISGNEIQGRHKGDFNRDLDGAGKALMKAFLRRTPRAYTFLLVPRLG